MPKRKVLAIWLDGYEQSLGVEMMRAGEMPSLSRFYEDSARFLLDHGSAQRTGLAGEHLSTGLSPEAAGRWGSVTFDPATYGVWQQGTSLEPFPARLKARTVVCDPTYFDLSRAPETRGVVGWAGHDPGTPSVSRPDGVMEEVRSRFGEYPARKWIYGVPWPSAERCRQAAEGLVAGITTRTQVARWLLSERLPDWDLALIGAGEPHSAIEAMWHGIDSEHQLHDIASAPVAGEGVRKVYRAIDNLVGDLESAFPDATVVVFSMGGMGSNKSDVQSMVLLPELLYRHAFNHSLLVQPERWNAADGRPLLGEDEGWYPEVPVGGRNQLKENAMTLAGRVARRIFGPGFRNGWPSRMGVDWMPAARYQQHWRRMRAFALPSFYDGRVRVNLAGRERDGMVSLQDYDAARDEVEALALACVNPLTGEGVVDHVERFEGDPLALDSTDADLVIVWKGQAFAVDHPQLGRVGPVPFRRTGGHTGPYGMAYLRGDGIAAGDYGMRSAFDVVPTLVELLDETLPSGLSGTSLLNALPLSRMRNA
jgi:predicted AlkP superfamily phosphohydrolase/phosphomutase